MKPGTFPLPPSESSHLDAYYNVSGFRSLQDFHLVLKPGLNVLVGGNGSGKTNFIEFLDFITSLVTGGGATAISSAGGIARVFSQESLRRRIPRVTAKICSIADLSPFIPGSRRKRFFRFEYEVDIRYSKFHTAVYIAHEKIKFKNLHSDDNFADADVTVGSLELHRKTPSIDEDPKWKFGTYLLSGSGRNPLRFLHTHRLAVSRAIRDTAGESQARIRLLEEVPPVAPDESFLSARTVFPALEAVRFALSRGRSFNLNPQRARQPDDISSPPSIEPDGSGLSSTLYQMQQVSKADPRRPSLRTRRFGKDALQTIIGWTQLVLPELQDITTTADPHTGKYLVYLIVGSENKILRIPLQSTSDGTLKWLAFVCLAVSHGAEYTFEEPENFLHPRMQQFLISLLRDVMAGERGTPRFILSTHSETVINECRPDELILFSFENGKTECKRVSNVESIIEEINQTGFGLGHYFRQNVVY